MKRYPTEQKKKMLYIHHRGLTYRIYKELKKLNVKKLNSLINKGANQMSRQFSKYEVQWWINT